MRNCKTLPTKCGRCVIHMLIAKEMFFKAVGVDLVTSLSLNDLKRSWPGHQPQQCANPRTWHSWVVSSRAGNSLLKFCFDFDWFMWATPRQGLVKTLGWSTLTIGILDYTFHTFGKIKKTVQILLIKNSFFNYYSQISKLQKTTEINSHMEHSFFLNLSLLCVR